MTIVRMILLCGFFFSDDFFSPINIYNSLFCAKIASSKPNFFWQNAGMFDKICRQNFLRLLIMLFELV